MPRNEKNHRIITSENPSKIIKSKHPEPSPADTGVWEQMCTKQPPLPTPNPF